MPTEEGWFREICGFEWFFWWIVKSSFSVYLQYQFTFLHTCAVTVSGSRLGRIAFDFWTFQSPIP